MNIHNLRIFSGYGGSVKIMALDENNNNVIIEKMDAESLLQAVINERNYKIDYTAPRQQYKRVIVVS